MTAGQIKAGARMIEGSPLPTLCGMTGTAIRAKLTIMFIICFMAGIAIGRRPFKFSASMAAQAIHLNMSPS